MDALIPHTEFGPPDGQNYETGWTGDFLEAQLVSNVGCRRKNNEDACILCAPDSLDLAEQNGYFFAVADGMGGALAGEQASRLALHTLIESYYAQAGAPIPHALRESVARANETVFNEAHSNPDFSGMGTTLSSVVVHGEWAYIAQVGDSRVYLLRDNDTLHQITRDHSLVAEQVRNGMISEEEARTHSLRNLITRAVGIKPVVEPDVFAVRLREGDTMMLCSDGLSGLVSDYQIAHLLQADNLALAVQKLVDRALQNGGSDNVTTVAVRVTGPLPFTNFHEGAEEVDVPELGWFRKLLRRLF